MSEVLIFGGTTEGRLLAEYCLSIGLSADISAATEYGGSLLPGEMKVYTGRLSAAEMTKLLERSNYYAVIDATHPYAVEVSHNIRIACTAAQTAYYRLIRDPEPVVGESVKNMAQMISLLNLSEDPILSTLGSKSAEALTAVKDFSSRIWLRMLPSDSIRETCTALGYAPDHLILKRGPFGTAQNIAHIRQSGARILLTKESGKAGGYPEKAAAAAVCGIRMITLCRPKETGCTMAEIKEILRREKGGRKRI